MLSNDTVRFCRQTYASPLAVSNPPRVTGTDPIPNRVMIKPWVIPKEDADAERTGNTEPDAVVAVKDRNTSAKAENAGNRKIELTDHHRQAKAERDQARKLKTTANVLKTVTPA